MIKRKRLVTVVLAIVMVIMSMSLGITAQAINFTPSFAKLTYETNTYALARSATYYYTDVGYIVSDSGATKSCRGIQGRDVANGYVSANGWVTGLSGIHVEVYISGQASNESIDQSDNRKCNMESDCSTVYSGTGTIIFATSYFKVNESCSYGHSRNTAYTSWSDVIVYRQTFQDGGNFNRRHPESK